MKKLVVLFFTCIACSFSLKGQKLEEICAECCKGPNKDSVIWALGLPEFEFIYTPNGSRVPTWLMCEYPDSERLADDASFAESPDLILIKTFDGVSHTARFNCHGFAWLNVEVDLDRVGEDYYTDRHIWYSGDFEIYYRYHEEVYWDDGSYVEVPEPIHPGKVSWDGGDHSAITTHDPDIVISKWGPGGPLVKHHILDCDYSNPAPLHLMSLI